MRYVVGAILLVLAASLSVVVAEWARGLGRRPWRELGTAAGWQWRHATSGGVRRQRRWVAGGAPTTPEVTLLWRPLSLVVARPDTGRLEEGTFEGATLADWVVWSRRQGGPPLLLVGPVGSGATTSLRQLAVRLSRGGRRRGLPGAVPVVVDAAGWAPRPGAGPAELADLVHRAMAPGTSLRRVQRWMTAGRVAVLVDGTGATELAGWAARLLPGGTVVVATAHDEPAAFAGCVLHARALRAADVQTLVRAWASDPEPLLERIGRSVVLGDRAGSPGGLRSLVEAPPVEGDLDGSDPAETSLGIGRSISAAGVSWRDYERFRAATGLARLPDPWPGGPVPVDRADAEVLGVRHADAAAYCRRLEEDHGRAFTYRLPTRDELIGAPGPRAWSLTMSHPALPTGQLPLLREFAQHEGFVPAPSPGAGAQHGCDLEEVGSLVAATGRVLRSTLESLGPVAPLAELSAVTEELAGVVGELAVDTDTDSDSDTDSEERRSPSSVHRREHARALGRRALELCRSVEAAETGPVPVLCKALAASYAGVVDELAALDDALAGETSLLPRLRWVRSSNRAPVDLESVLADAPARGRWERWAKPVLDRVVAAVLVVGLAPLFALLMVAIRLDSPGPALFVHTRVGRDGRLFPLFKFRSMRVASDPTPASQSLLFKTMSDPRITRMGRLLRRTSLDELPQLLNVLGGTMSLVGPRPFLRSETEAMEAPFLQRLLVKPGMTGLWQVRGRSDLNWSESMALDVAYVRDCSMALDLRILLATPLAVVTGRGAY